VRHAGNEEAWEESEIEISKREETEEYKKWNEENKRLQLQANNLLEDFYKNRETDNHKKIITDERSSGFRIHNGGDDCISLVEDRSELSEEEKESLTKRLKEYQKEMQEFTEFLKEKFLSDQ